MSPELLVSLIGSLGFPIVACCALFWFINKTMKDVTETIRNNTAMVQKLVEKLK